MKSERLINPPKLICVILCVLLLIIAVVPPMGVSANVFDDVADVFLSLLASIGVTFGDSSGGGVGREEVLVNASRLYDNLSPAQKEFLQEKGRGVSSGGGAGRRFDISLDEYSAFKSAVQQVLRSEESGNQYILYSHEKNGINISTPNSYIDEKILKDFYLTGNAIPIERNIIYTVWTYTTADFLAYTSGKYYKSDYYYIDFMINNQNNVLLKVHGENEWGFVDPIFSGNIYFTSIVQTISNKYYYWCGLVFNDTIYSFCDNSNTLFNSFPDRIYINFNSNASESIDKSKIEIDEQVYNTTIIEENWQKVIDNGGCSIQSFNVLAIDDLVGNESSGGGAGRIIPAVIINPDEPVEPPTEPPTEPDEPIVNDEKNPWYQKFYDFFVILGDTITEQTEKIIDKITGKEVETPADDFHELDLSELNDSISELNDFQSGLSDDLESSYSDVEKYMDNANLQEYKSGFSFVNSVFGQIWDSLGSYQYVVLIGPLLGICMLFIGRRFRHG